MLSSMNDIRDLLSRHDSYRRRCLNLIASENIPSTTVRRFLTCDLGGRYTTYFDDPAARNYKGTKFMAEIEIAAQELARKVYDAAFVDFRPLGGHMAGVGVICALTRPGDTVFETGDMGGHKTASKLVSAGLLRGSLNVEYIPYDVEEHDIDMEALKRLVRDRKPKLIIFGRDQILFPENIEPIREVADEVGAYVAYDLSHVHGLIAGKAFPNPLDQGADVMLGSHHKTIPGPQGGLYITRNEEIFKEVRQGVYPPLVTNHHVERAPALAATYLEMLAFGEAYAQQIVRNSQALGQALHDRGIMALYPHKGFSQSHQVIVDVAEFGSGGEVADLLEQANIICGKTMVPSDLGHEGKTVSGLRLGTQELTRIGMLERDMAEVAEFFGRVIIEREAPDRVAGDVADFTNGFTEIKYCFDEGVDPFEALWKHVRAETDPQ